MKNIISALRNRSIKANFFLNSSRVVFGALIGFAILPYITRVLGPQNFGKVEYIYVIINYFILFSALGIPIYGIREISKVRDDKRLEAKTVVELLIILLTTSVISYILIFGILYQLNFFEDYRTLLLVFSSMILLVNMGAEWYFQGTENQLFITIRYFVVRILAVFFVFKFIQTQDDYLYYALFIVLLVCGSNVINFYYLMKKILPFKLQWDELEIKKHLKPIFTVFVATLSVNIYLQLDNLLIGSISGDTYVGYYSVANRMIRFVITLITVLGTVMLPRLSQLYTQDKEQYFIYLKRSLYYLFFLSVPSTVYFFIFSKEIVLLFFGEKFSSSILTMKILSPLCMIVSLAYFMGFLVLYPQNKEKIYTIATLVSAVFSLGVNYFVIQKFQQNGAAVVAVISELLAVLIMTYFIIKNKFVNTLFDKNMLLIFISGLVTFFITYLLWKIMNQTLIMFTLFSILMFGLYLLMTLFMKEKITLELIGFVSKKNKEKC